LRFGLPASTHVPYALLTACEAGWDAEAALGVWGRAQARGVQASGATRGLLRRISERELDNLTATQGALNTFSVVGAALAGLLVNKGFI
jgi:hypothetical protein